MSNLSPADREYLENALRMHNGYVHNFSDKTFSEFFNEFGINIDDTKYLINGTSKANRMRAFWKLDDNNTVGTIILELAGLVRNEELRYPRNVLFSPQMEKIANKLLHMPNKTITTKTEVPVVSSDKELSIIIKPAIYNHVRKFLDVEDYFHALEESYKIVRKRLRDITGSERATDAFAEKNFPIIFGHSPKDEVERDFFSGIKFLHMALQCFRNEKAHDLAKQIDKNIAIHYLAVASLAYDLITRAKKK